MTFTVPLNIELSSNLKAAPCNTPLLIAYKDGTTRQEMRATDDWHWPDKDAVGWALMPGVDIKQLKNGHLPEWAREHVTLDGWERRPEHISYPVGDCWVSVYEDGCVVFVETTWHLHTRCAAAIKAAEKLIKALFELETMLKVSRV